MTIHRTRPVAAVAIATLLVAPGVASAVTTTTGSSATRPTATATVAEPQTERVTVAAPSLDGNLLGDPSEVEVEVQTPGSYATSPERRYPVVYFLAGYDEPASVRSIGLELQQLVSDGEADEMILVGVSGDNALGGSFYVDSPVSGRWASAIVNDVVGAIDEQYRTLATPASRGIAGFSMGGYGALGAGHGEPRRLRSRVCTEPGIVRPRRTRRVADVRRSDGRRRLPRRPTRARRDVPTRRRRRVAASHGTQRRPSVQRRVRCGVRTQPGRTTAVDPIPDHRCRW